MRLPVLVQRTEDMTMAIIEAPIRASRETGSPERYRGIDSEILAEAIERRRQELGEALLVLAHHYQRDEIVQHADFIGDSLRLSVRAAAASRERGVKWIAFCGVGFMAETADVLTDERIRVILPNRAARCPMAAMAEHDDVRLALERLANSDAGAAPLPLVPVAYVNSTAAVKSIVGERGGACCTSANAEAIMRWALKGGERLSGSAHAGGADGAGGVGGRVLFLPDEHLSRNVCATLGIPESEQALWDPSAPATDGALQRVREARVIHWKGHCYVHTRFKKRDVDAARAASKVEGDPVNIVVHPECTADVVAAADSAVSTESMVKMIATAAPGSRFRLGTEAHLVRRLAREAAQRGVEVRMLGEGVPPMCGAMLQISPQDLLWSLDELVNGRIVNEVRVAAEHRPGARLALDRMLRISA